jgi:hypothetical protein
VIVSHFSEQKDNVSDVGLMNSTSGGTGSSDRIVIACRIAIIDRPRSD